MVQRHLQSRFRATASDHNLQAYAALRAALKDFNDTLILDSFCGTGHSSCEIARRHPQALVVGIDKSASRLSKHPEPAAENCLLLRADCEPIWQLLARDGIKLARHYLLYPNPWPKSQHLKRRIHGHPCFADLLQLGGALELRSNWQLYVEEFGVAMGIGGAAGAISQVPADEEPLSLFERKYRDSGHTLWTYRCTLT